SARQTVIELGDAGQFIEKDLPVLGRPNHRDYAVIAQGPRPYAARADRERAALRTSAAVISARSSGSRQYFPTAVEARDLRPHRPQRSWHQMPMRWRGRSGHDLRQYRPHHLRPSAGQIPRSRSPRYMAKSVGMMLTVRTVVPRQVPARG